jgi:hypothetical protein
VDPTDPGINTQTQATLFLLAQVVEQRTVDPQAGFTIMGVAPGLSPGPGNKKKSFPFCSPRVGVGLALDYMHDA